MNNDKNIVNEDEIIALINDLDKYSENISELFDKIDQEIGDLPEYYKSSACEALMTSYQEFRKNYKTIKNNLSTFSDDYICLVQKMKSGDKVLTGMVNKFTEGYEAKAKEVKF